MSHCWCTAKPQSRSSTPGVLCSNCSSPDPHSRKSHAYMHTYVYTTHMHTHLVNTRSSAQQLLFVRSFLHHEQTSIIVSVHVYEASPILHGDQLKQLKAGDLQDNNMYVCMSVYTNVKFKHQLTQLNAGDLHGHHMYVCMYVRMYVSRSKIFKGDLFNVIQHIVAASTLTITLSIV